MAWDPKREPSRIWCLVRAIGGFMTNLIPRRKVGPVLSTLCHVAPGRAPRPQSGSALMATLLSPTIKCISTRFGGPHRSSVHISFQGPVCWAAAAPS